MNKKFLDGSDMFLSSNNILNENEIELISFYNINYLLIY